MIQRLGGVRAWFGRLAAIGRDLLFPPQCLLCGELITTEAPQATMLCGPCLNRVIPADWRGCQRCGRLLSGQANPIEACPACCHGRLKFDAAVALGGYHSGLREAILRMKRPSNQALSVAIGRLLASRRWDQLKQYQADLVVPVPMFWRRRLSRGVNSPDVLAGCIGTALRLRVRLDVLVRHRNTLPQADLPPSKRFDNVRGAFRVRRPKVVHGARVLLVDDVLTTGATCSEAAKALKHSGAAAVLVAVAARAEGGMV